MINKVYLCIIAIIVTLTVYSMVPFLIVDFQHFEYLYPFKAGWNVNQSEGIGDEYLMLAKSLVNGNGFSDPFGFRTGPSAWMPPLYSFIIAANLLLFGTIYGTMWSLTIIKGLTLIFSMIVVYRLCQNTTRAIPSWISIVLFVCWYWVFFLWFFESLHDVWLLILFSTLILYELSAKQDSFRNHILIWSSLGALIVLTSPVLFFSWSLVTIKKTVQGNFIRLVFLAFSLPLLVGGIWTYRNYLVLGHFIPIKSNVYYELYLSSLGTSDGIYTNNTFNNHPYILNISGKLDLRTAPDSELAIVDDAKQRFFKYIKHYPIDFIIKVGNRFLATTIFYKPFVATIEGTRPIFASIVYPLPFIGLLLLVGLRRRVISDLQQHCVLIYFSYILPYALVAFYERYILGITPILILLTFWGIDSITRTLTIKNQKLPSTIVS